MSNDKISYKEINRLAIPAIFAGMAEPIIGLVDTGIIGHLGADTEISQSAVGLASGFYAIMLWSLAQIRTAISSLVSQYIGANNVQAILTLVPQTIFFGAMLGLILGGVSFVFSDSIFTGFYGVNPSETALIDKASAYFRIRAVGLPISLIVYTLFGVFRGVQNTYWIMIASLSGALLNVLLDYVLVFGIGDFQPNMGIEGVAIASVASQVLMMVITLYFLKKKTPFTILPSLKINPQFIKMIKMSGNMVIRTLALNFVFYLANFYATKYGKPQLAAHTIMMQFWVLTFFVIDGFSNAGNALAGKLMGGKDFKKLGLLIKDLIKMNLRVALVLATILSLLYPVLGYVFSNEPLVIGYFNQTFWILILAQFVSAVTFTYDGIFKGLGETAYLRNTLVIGSFCVFWPLIIGLDYIRFEMWAIWFPFIAWNAFRGVSLIYRYNRKYKVD